MVDEMLNVFSKGEEFRGHGNRKIPLHENWIIFRVTQTSFKSITYPCSSCDSKQPMMKIALYIITSLLLYSHGKLYVVKAVASQTHLPTQP